MINKRIKKTLEEYMVWLENFTVKSPGISSDFVEKNHRNSDKRMISNIEEIFDIVKAYVIANDMESNLSEDMFFSHENYYVRYNGQVYAIGYVEENEKIYNCFVVNDENSVKDVIEYDDLTKYLLEKKNKVVKVLKR